MNIANLGQMFKLNKMRFLHFMASQRALPVYKGALAYLIGFVLIFLKDFDKLHKYPATLVSMPILILVGNPGKSVGACIQTTFLALFGVSLGSLCFIVLANLAHSRISQGFVFALMVYVFALVRARGSKWFSLTLQAILMAFNGIYTSVLPGGFNAGYLVELLKVYCIATVIVLSVNILIFPVTSEKELRGTLIHSLEHIATFSHLLAKGYTLELSEEEREVRAQLAQNIRADFGFLTQKIEETSIEINISRFSMTDYQEFVMRTRRMQLALITVYSTLVGFEERDLKLFKTKFLPNTIESFNSLCMALNGTMQEICAELGCEPISIAMSQPGYAEFMERSFEKQGPSRRVCRNGSHLLPSVRQQIQDTDVEDIEQRLHAVTKRLKEEFGNGDVDPGARNNENGERDLSISECKRPSIPKVVVVFEGDSVGVEEGKQTEHVSSVPLVPFDGQDTSLFSGVSTLRLHEEPQEISEGQADTTQASGSSAAAQTSPQLPPLYRKDTGSSSQHPHHFMHSLRRVFDTFITDQQTILTEALVSGSLHGGNDSLRITEPLPSLKDMYDYYYAPSRTAEVDGKVMRRAHKARRRDWMSVDSGDWSHANSGAVTPVSSPPSSDVPQRGAKECEYYEIIRARSELEKTGDTVSAASHHSLTRVYSFVFAMEQFVNELEQLYYTCKKKSKRRIHIHIYESIHRPHTKPPILATATPMPMDPMLPTTNPATGSMPPVTEAEKEYTHDLSVSEALALLEHRPYTPPKHNTFQQLERVEHWFHTPNSIYAAKTACAVTIFAVLILHPVPRPWFIKFGMSGGAVTIVSALTPTLGQSITTFIFQILGTGVGYLWALFILQLFKDLGGYKFNPYGLVCMLAPYALASFYILYEKPQFFVAAMLALNGTGSFIILEWVYVEYQRDENYDTPLLRFAKFYATLGVALGLTGIFQLFILRNPARRTLRKRIGGLLFAQLSYITLLQAYVRGTMPCETSRRAPQAALVRVERELRYRELKMQAELIDLRPLVVFSAAEPQFSRPFKEDSINQLLRSSQFTLDRLRECRTAIGTRPLPDFVVNGFTRVLVPYRRRYTQFLQLAFYLIASSVTAKSPLPREIPAELVGVGPISNAIHDVLVLASRHAKTVDGANMIKSGDFTRYFHYFVCITALPEQWKVMEDACKDLFGELDDKLI